jgi:GT2 family glycosyltransferase
MIRFGGFIITYHRTEILMNTLDLVFNQSLKPEVIWIIDNSEDSHTFSALIKRDNPRIKYYSMENNAGPAAAAKKGLELCGMEDLDWIYWGKDNDPPQHPDTFEKLLSVKDENPYCGILGSAGYFFDHKKGEIKRIQSRLLERKKSLEVEVIVGGMSMLVQKEVVKAGIFPNPDLFYGYEELDFCLKAKRRGFTMMVHCGLFMDLRVKNYRSDFESLLNEKKNNLVREYYNLRNLLYISDELTLGEMKKRLIRKWIGKSIYGFRYGPVYGTKNFRYIFLAFLHYYKGIKGKTLSLD